VLAIQILLYYLLAVVFKILQTKHKANIDISLQYSTVHVGYCARRRLLYVAAELKICSAGPVIAPVLYPFYSGIG